MMKRTVELPLVFLDSLFFSNNGEDKEEPQE
jgi:hypothetical protein